MRIQNTLLARALGAILLAAAAGCENPADPSLETTVTFRPAERAVTVGDSAHLAFTAADGDGNAVARPRLSWSSSDTAVARVDSAGVVLAVRVGTAVVRAAAGRNSDSVRLAVRDPDPVAWRSVVSFGGTGAATCGLQGDGRVYCWTADGPAEGYAMPDQRFTAISVGEGVCGITAEGALFCRTQGQLFTTAPRSFSEHAFRQISGGPNVGCGITLDGRTLCWREGAIQRVNPDPGFVSLNVRDTACGLTADGTAHCWTPGSATAPVPTTVRFASIQAGRHNCALTTQGEAYCWGSNSTYGLGITRVARDGCVSGGRTPTGVEVYDCPVPQRVATELRFAEIRVGADHSCARAVDGRAYCWGTNVLRSLGVPDATVRAAPVNETCRLGGSYGCTPSVLPVAGGRAFATLGTGSRNLHMCAIDAQGAAYCWGAVASYGVPRMGSLSDETQGTAPPVRLREPKRTPNTAR